MAALNVHVEEQLDEGEVGTLGALKPLPEVKLHKIKTNPKW
jgi:hypothetical protein